MRQVLKQKMALTWCLVLLFASLTSQATAQDLSKYHALFIGKFIDYIEWPEGKGNITIGVVGDTHVFDQLQASLGERGKATIKKVSSTEDIADCQVVFIPTSQNKQFDSIKSALAKKGVLLVTESEQYAKKGASISFYLDSGKLRFMLNESAAQDHNLRVSSGLLSLATVL